MSSHPRVPGTVTRMVEQRCPNCHGTLRLDEYCLGRFELCCLLCWWRQEYDTQGQLIEALPLRHQLGGTSRRKLAASEKP